jgi:MtN3 and saliva related transmembrane protein
MNLISAIGTVGAICSTVSFAPQAWKIIKTRETKDISTGMYVFTVVGFAAWTTYGIMLGEWPLIASNSICLVLSGFILMMDILPQAKKDEVCELIEEEVERGRR